MLPSGRVERPHNTRGIEYSPQKGKALAEVYINPGLTATLYVLRILKASLTSIHLTPSMLAMCQNKVQHYLKECNKLLHQTMENSQCLASNQSTDRCPS